jgi:YXWGXW repeat-containing protein
MMKRKALFAAIFASTLGALPLAASADKVIVVQEAPPPLRHEVVPEARHGYVWAPGYWDYRHGHYAWVNGHWERERHGMYWHPNRWEQRDGQWVFERGRWDKERFAENRHDRDHDRDHDGVPNSRDHDRDGDGVPNRVDRAPDNPHRQ